MIKVIFIAAALLTARTLNIAFRAGFTSARVHRWSVPADALLSVDLAMLHARIWAASMAVVAAVGAWFWWDSRKRRRKARPGGPSTSPTTRPPRVARLDRNAKYGWKDSAPMPSNNRARARAAISATPRMDRDSVGGVTATLAFAELMAAGGRAARATDGGLPAAVAAVRAAVLPLWPGTVPEAARDVLVACADLAVTRHVVAAPDELGESLIASEMLDLTAGWVADKRSAPAGGQVTPPVAYASSCAFDRDDDAAVLDAVCLLLALAHPAGDVVSPEDWQADDRGCPECGGDGPQGTYGCSCFDPSACRECGDNTGQCDCWI